MWEKIVEVRGGKEEVVKVREEVAEEITEVVLSRYPEEVDEEVME